MDRIDRVQVQALGRRLKDMYEPVVRNPLSDAIMDKLEALRCIEAGRAQPHGEAAQDLAQSTRANR